MSSYYFKGSQIDHNFLPNAWETIIFKEFETTLMSKTRPFPCIFGVAGFQQDQLRYHFSDLPLAHNIAPSLKHFVHHSREYGKNTSLVVFFKPEPIKTIEDYQNCFWKCESVWFKFHYLFIFV